jgi:hypothetical protein
MDLMMMGPDPKKADMRKPDMRKGNQFPEPGQDFA